jgi:micrococcal nuclease
MRHLHFVSTLGFGLALAIAGPASAADLSGKVLSVGDGDTITVQTSSSKVTVRLGCIDAAEIAQSPYGKASTDQLKTFLPVGKPVRIRAIETDRYSRTVGEVFVGEQLVNLDMVKLGQAVVYRQYLGGCKSSEKQYLQAEAAAKSRKIGWWNQPSNCMVMPWDFRRGVQSSCEITKPAQGYVSGTCKELKQKGIYGPFYKKDGDPNYRPERDRDKDGIACE